MSFRALVCIALLSLIACSSPEPPTKPAATAPAKSRPSEPDLSIHWFDGTVAEAFAQAKDAQKPLFLYWGAVWCPPCNQIKSTVFTDPDFIRQTRDFISVYLDGDSEDAQSWGEHFSAMGYPTLILFDSKGQELTRISSGMDLSAYTEVLGLARSGAQSVAELIARFRADPANLQPQDWQLLAYYAWPGDQGRVVAAASRATLLDELARQCPPDLPHLRARFSLLAAIETLDQNAAPAWSEDKKRSLRQLLHELLENRQWFRANLTELQYDAPRLLIAVSSEHSAERQALVMRLRRRMEEAFRDEALPLRQRLLGTYTEVELHRQQHPESSVPAELQQLVRERAIYANEQARSAHERQSLIYTMANLLHAVDLSDEARAMFTAELDRSVAPYYYMLYLADLEQELGQTEKALQWAWRAWQAAQGPATRVQWGLSYVKRLLENTPQDYQQIEEVLGSLFDELGDHPGAFYQRSRVRLERNLEPLQQWRSDPRARQVLERLQRRIQRSCVALREESESAKICAAYLELAN